MRRHALFVCELWLILLNVIPSCVHLPADSLGINIPESNRAESYNGSIFSFLRNGILISIEAPLFMFSLAVCRSSFCPHPHLNLLGRGGVFTDDNHSDGSETESQSSFIFQIPDVGHCFTHSLFTCISSFWELSVQLIY